MNFNRPCRYVFLYIVIIMLSVESKTATIEGGVRKDEEKARVYLQVSWIDQAYKITNCIF